MEKSVELIFVPVPGITHLVSSMEFAKLLVHRHDKVLITVLTMKPPPSSVAYQTDYVKSISGAEPRIRVIDLPESDPVSPEVWAECPETFIAQAAESYVPAVRDVVARIVATRPESIRVSGLILDFFCVPMMDVGDEFGLPSYIFLTTNAGFLNLMLHISDREPGTEFCGSDLELQVPGFGNPVPALVLPPGMFNKSGHDTCVKLARRFRDAKGIFVNSFAELEPHAFSCFSDDEFQRQNRNPPVYAVGPVLDLEARAHRVTDKAGYDKLMSWLDDQPPKSVLFLCFGSMGCFGAPQTNEIAIALERSGYRFIWTVREPPEGFVERIGGRGVVCEWAPQVEVLAHVAVGGFVSHCGWNSVLESLWNRVPIATWPLYAEQQLNAFLMVKELGGLAVEMRLGSRVGGDLVCADEIESAVRRLMDGDGEVRKKVDEVGAVAKKALTDGGSSFVSIGRLIDDIVGKN